MENVNKILGTYKKSNINKAVGSLQGKCSNFRYSYLQKWSKWYTVVRKRLWWSIITYHISQTENKMKPPKRCLLWNTPSGPVVKILKKIIWRSSLFIKVARCCPATYLTRSCQMVTKGLTYLNKLLLKAAGLFRNVWPFVTTCNGRVRMNSFLRRNTSQRLLLASGYGSVLYDS